MEKILKGWLDQKQKYHVSWMVTTIKILIEKPVKLLRPPVFSFRWTQETALQNRNILSGVDENLGDSIEAQNRIPLYYGSELRYISGSNNQLQELDKGIKMAKIPKG